MKKNIISVVLILVFSGLALGVQPDDADLISLDLKGMDIRDVLKILSQKSGLNIVADSEVSGTVTLYLKDVSIADAVAIVASTNKLAYEQTGSLIRMMKEKDYKKLHGKSFEDNTKQEVIKLNYANAAEVGKALLEAKSAIGRVIYEDVSDTIVIIDTPENIKRMKEIISSMDAPLVTEVFPLDYAKAESLKDKIGQMVSKGIGSVEFDEKTNKLVVKDTQARIEDVRKVISAFDEKIKQVLIEANIVQVMLLDKYSYGIDWAELSKIGGVNLTAPAGLNIATTGVNYSTIEPLLKTYGETNVLSRPRLTVIDAQEAKIMVGAKEVYVTSDVTTTSGGTYHSSEQVKFVDVGVRLAVTPEINRAGFIILKIKPEVSNADAAKRIQLKNPDGSTRAVVPYVTTSEAETSVVVKDGTTVIISGLMKDALVDYKGGKIKRKTELVIFLTPHIIEGDTMMVYKEKYPVDLEKKSESVGIEKPKEIEIKPSEIAPEIKESALKNPETKKRYSNSKTRQPEPNIITKETKQPKQKWTPIFGASSRKVKNTENPILEAEIREVENNPISAAKNSARLPYTGSTSYEEYYFMLRQEINDLAREDKDIAGIKGEVELQFTLDKEGFLINGPTVLNNPDLRLVRSVVRVVKKAAPFNRFPKALKKNQADFNVIVRYE